MLQIFDHELFARRLRRAMKAARPGADFLLRHIANDMTDRLRLIERRFDHPVLLHGFSVLPAELFETSGKTSRFMIVSMSPGADLDGRAHIHAGLERIGLGKKTVDLISAPACLHIVNDVPGLLIQARRALKPDGLFLAAAPGAGTLDELRQALLEADSRLHGGVHARVHPFADIRDYGALMQRAGFSLPVIDREELTIRYDDIFALIGDLRAFGMTNLLFERSRRPVSRDFFRLAGEIYAERFSDSDGRIRASFPIIHLSGWAPHESQQKPLRPGSAHMRLSDALKNAASHT